MWMTITARRGLTSLVDSPSELAAMAHPAEPRLLVHQDLSSDIGLLWRDAPKGKDASPSAVLISKESQRDFLAWVSTYLPVRPFTAFFRFTDPATAAILLDEVKQNKLTEQWRAPMLGMILAEALSDPQASESSEVGYQACLSTLSFALARAATAGLLPIKMEEAATAWSQVQSGSPVQAKAEQNTWPWLALMDLAGVSNPHGDEGLLAIVDACRNLMEGDASSALRVDSMMSSAGLAMNDVMALNEREVTRETRVVEIERILRQLAGRSFPDNRGRRNASFVAGYAVSRIAPGTLDHIELLKLTATNLPSSRMWYGLIAGLSKGSSVFRFGAGFGLRVSREAFRTEDFWSAPTSDMAIAEFQLLTNNPNSTALMNRFSERGRLSVEILPTVTTVVSRQAKGIKDSGRLFGSDVDLEEVKRLAVEVRRAIGSADNAQFRLEKALGTSNESSSYARQQKKGKKGQYR